MSTYDPRDVPVRRGRRDPEMAVALGLSPSGQEDQAQDVEQEVDEIDQEGYPMVDDGDELSATISVSLPVDGHDAWISYKATVHVGDGETEESANWRLATQVKTRWTEMHADAEDAVRERKRERRGRLQAREEARQEQSP